MPASAHKLVASLLRRGHKALQRGSWIVWEPSPPSHLLKRLLACHPLKLLAALRSVQREMK